MSTVWALGDYHRFATTLIWHFGPELVADTRIERGTRVLDVAAGYATAADAGVAVAATVVQCPDRRLRRSVRDEGWQGVRRLFGAPVPSGWLGRMRSR